MCEIDAALLGFLEQCVRIGAELVAIRIAACGSLVGEPLAVPYFLRLDRWLTTNAL
jgi:hypothetical protein